MQIRQRSRQHVEVTIRVHQGGPGARRDDADEAAEELADRAAARSEGTVGDRGSATTASAPEKRSRSAARRTIPRTATPRSTSCSTRADPDDAGSSGDQTVSFVRSSDWVTDTRAMLSYCTRRKTRTDCKISALAETGRT